MKDRLVNVFFGTNSGNGLEISEIPRFATFMFFFALTIAITFSLYIAGILYATYLHLMFLYRKNWIRATKKNLYKKSYLLFAFMLIAPFIAQLFLKDYLIMVSSGFSKSFRPDSFLSILNYSFWLFGGVVCLFVYLFIVYNTTIFRTIPQYLNGNFWLFLSLVALLSTVVLHAYFLF